MNLDELIKLLKNQFPDIDCSLVKKKILTYKEFLQKQNKIHNLTRLDKESDVYQKYFYESIINFKNELFENKNINVLDIGSGSGIPGIILKIIFPFISLYIVDSNKKKTTFLSKLIEILELKNVYISNSRCEEYIKNKIEFFDLITCRAVAELRILLEISFPGLKKGGTAFFLKSQNYLEEIENSKLISKNLCIEENPIIDEIEYDQRKFISLKYIKKNPTSKKFPRTWKEILTNDKN